MIRKVMKILGIGLALWGMVLVTGAEARTKEDTGQKNRPARPQAAAVAEELRVHNVGKFWLSVTNYGIFGSESGGLADPCTRQSAPSAEFPAGTGVSYLFQGALWVGAIKGEAETLVTVGADGWQQVNEMIAELPFSTRTIRPAGIQQGSCFIPYSDSAVSEQDLIAVYVDTCSDPSLCDSDPLDGPFVPLDIKITQKSYAWSYDYAQDFVLFDYILQNIGETKLNQVYLALYIDADNHNPDVDAAGFQDDISGFKGSVPSFRCPELYEDTLNLAWTGDNNGLSNCSICEDNRKGVFVPTYSPTSLAGTRVVKTPGEVKTSFNWWNSQGDASLDWGPWTIQNLGKRPEKFPGGVLGTPEGNKAKYFIMSNGEFDYDQLWSALSIWQDSGWLPPPGNIDDLADGYDTRYLLSFGPFNINPGDTLPLTLAYIAGENFHVRPSDWNIVQGNITSLSAVQAYYNTKDLSDFATNARWAGWVYDNPGIDSDTLNAPDFKGLYRICQGDTVYYEGDGIPDFKGPPPPNPPVLKFDASEGKVAVNWNGLFTETSLDNFSNEADFEGYRIWLSRSGIPDDYALLDSYDKKDFKMYIFNPGTQKWALKIASMDSATAVNLFAYDNICCYADNGGCTCLDPQFCQDPSAFGENPLKWTQQNPYSYKGSCQQELVITASVSVRIGDQVAFEPQDWNQDLTALKKYASEIEQGIYTPADSEYYEYEYVIDSLSPSTPVYIAVSAFDYGNPQTGLAPLETSPLVNARSVWPLPSPPEGTVGKKVVVFPNPYKISESYPLEDRNLPSGKRIHFVQLPGACTIRIFTLDGDEVVVIENPDPINPEVSWNLISSNGQEVVAGVYIYHIESDRGDQIGKFVLVK